MAYPVAAGKSSQSGSYIPEIWSKKLIKKFYDYTCLSEVTNNEYEGEITAKGDKVIIRGLPTLTIRDYVDGADLVYEDIKTTPLELLIDKGKYWAFPATIVDLKQADIPFINKWSEDGAKQLKISIETAVFGDIYADAHASNKGATAGVKSSSINLGTSGAAVALTKDNVLDFIIDVGLVLDEQNIPEDARNIILPPWCCALIKKSDLKDASITGDGKSTLRTGVVGVIDRFQIFSSNLLTSATDGAHTAYHAMAMHKYATTFASQITENEELANPRSFGRLVRGLQVYGYKVIKPEALCDLYIRKG